MSQNALSRKVNGNGKVILDTHPESDQHQNWTCSRGSTPAPTHQNWWWSMSPFLRYLADKNNAHRQTDRHTPMTTRPCGLRRAGNNSSHLPSLSSPTQRLAMSHRNLKFSFQSWQCALNKCLYYCYYYPCDALHSVVFAVAQCPSVCLSHVGIVSKRLNIS